MVIIHQSFYFLISSYFFRLTKNEATRRASGPKSKPWSKINPQLALTGGVLLLLYERATLPRNCVVELVSTAFVWQANNPSLPTSYNVRRGPIVAIYYIQWKDENAPRQSKNILRLKMVKVIQIKWYSWGGIILMSPRDSVVCENKYDVF